MHSGDILQSVGIPLYELDNEIAGPRSFANSGGSSVRAVHAKLLYAVWMSQLRKGVDTGGQITDLLGRAACSARQSPRGRRQSPLSAPAKSMRHAEMNAPVQGDRLDTLMVACHGPWREGGKRRRPRGDRRLGMGARLLEKRRAIKPKHY